MMGNSQAGEQITAKGRIVSLFDYLSSGATAGLSVGGSSATASSQSQQQQPGTTAGQPSANLGLSAIGRQGEPLVLIVESTESAGASTGASATSSSTSTSTSATKPNYNPSSKTTLPGTAASTSSTSATPAGTSNVGLQATDDNKPVTGTGAAGTTASSSRGMGMEHMNAMAGEAFLLVFDPANPQSRSAYQTAQSIAQATVSPLGSQSAAGQTAGQSSSQSRDRLQVRESVTGHGVNASIGSEKVQVTGKIMRRGEMKAIEVTSASRANEANESGSSLTQPGKSTTPSSSSQDKSK